MAKKFGHPTEVSATTIAPGVRYYGPPALRPSTPYKRGGERGAEFDPTKYIDLDKSKVTKAQPQPTPEQLQGQSFLPPIPEQTPEQIKDPGWWERTKTRLLRELVPWSPEAEEARDPDAMERRMQAISEATGIPSGLVEPLGTLAAVPLTSVMKAGSKMVKMGEYAYKSGKWIKIAEITKTIGPQIKANPKTINLIGQIIAKNAGWAATGILVTAGAVGTAFWGLYTGAAEGTEATNIISNKILDRAQWTGDYALVDKAIEDLETISEAVDPEKLVNQIPGWGLGRNIYYRYQNNVNAIKLLKMHVEDLKSGESQEEAITRRLKEKEESQMRIADYIDTLTRARIAAQAKASEDELLAWKGAQVDLLALKAKMQKENQEFWLKYLQMKIKFWTEYQTGRGESPSQLGFGLLG